ncbi:GNAT family N-acetyltransferase [Nitrobacter vulgaris]|uniref:GNAT family N-acetyltransferase n=1 Tax=Nitrobacter vulgaris TaxID=29421 RepID=A0A1V4HWL9_NITVU|nr:GNAT family N-acetyltransferase [Nitrobacter vulgaris]OPH82368.1 GNAT family N-acetyltransferase [Nitrobacter vulgaris]
MYIDVIEDMDAFSQLRENWDEVYDADPHATLYLSWNWLFPWLENLNTPWVVLAAKESGSASRYVAFFPLRLDTRIDGTGRLFNDLRMAGSHAADYTGLISIPESEADAIVAFAQQIKRMNWADLVLDNFCGSDVRFSKLVSCFSQSKFTISQTDRVNKTDQVDNSICPYVDLPEDWDAYLETISSNTRQKLRRLLRAVDTNSEYRITHATKETVAADLNTLLRFWETKWRPRKGKLTDSLVRGHRGMLSRSFERGLLLLPTLWLGDRPLAALAILLDEQKKSLLFYITGRDESFAGPQPGLILHGHSIRYAISRGMKRYDFLRGNERYKYSFGVKEQRLYCYVVATRSGSNLGGRLDVRTLPDALKKATDLHQEGKIDQAARAYRQILETDPRNENTLHRYGQLLAGKSDHVAAKRVFKLLTRMRTDTYKPWLLLGQSCEAMGQYLDAANAYREVIRLQPGVPDIFSKLANVLFKAGRIEDARKALMTSYGVGVAGGEGDASFRVH